MKRRLFGSLLAVAVLATPSSTRAAPAQPRSAEPARPTADPTADPAPPARSAAADPAPRSATPQPAPARTAPPRTAPSRPTPPPPPPPTLTPPAPLKRPCLGPPPCRHHKKAGCGCKKKKRPPLYLSLAGGKAAVWFRLQLRDRFEVSGGRDFKVGGRREWVSQRARIGLGASLLHRVELFLQVADVRTWGEETNTLGDYSADGFDLHQAYAKVRLVKGLKLQIGRQELVYDNHRLLGNVNWTQQGRSFDAARLTFDRGPWHAHLFYSRYAEKNSAAWAELGDQSLIGLWAKWTRFKFFKPSLIFLADLNDDPAAERERFTFGLRIHGGFKGLLYDLEYYHQLGSQGAVDINAFMVGARVGYRAPVKTHPMVMAWVDYLSGDDDPTDNQRKAFDTLFATNHKFYGFMDLFLNIPVHTGQRGLMDIGGRAQIQPCKCLKFFLDYHAFQLAQKDAADRRFLGHEIDVVGVWKIWKGVSLATGYGVFLPGSAMTALKDGGDDPEHWFFLQTNVQF